MTGWPAPWDDPAWSDVYGGKNKPSSIGGLWVENVSQYCYEVIALEDDMYTLRRGDGALITVLTNTLPRMFRPT